MGVFNISEQYPVIYADTAPSTVSGTADGTLWVCSGCNRTFSYNQIKDAWYSVSDLVLSFNRDGPTGNVYLCVGETNDSATGYVLHVDFAITAIRAKAASGDDLTYKIYSGDNLIYSFSTSSLAYNNDDVFVNADKDELLRIYAEKAGASSVTSPVVNLDIAWRH
jgi:hypothetical protein